jgi:hypothetical protein
VKKDRVREGKRFGLDHFRGTVKQMSAKPDYVVSKLTRPVGGAATGGFVINLTSSTTPMALSQPKDPTLAQYTFFVSRRLEDGRERFRLHMGYFESMQSAEEMLVVVRDVYPGAWASEAPGKKLRANNPAAPARAASPAVAAAQPVATSVAAPAPVAAAPLAPPPVAVAPAAPAPIAAPERPFVPAIAEAPVRHPFEAAPPPPVLTYEHEEPFELTDETEFKPVNVPVVHPPAAPVVSAQPKPAPAKAAAKPAAKPAAPKAAAPKAAATKPVAPKTVAAKPAPQKPTAAAAAAPRPAAVAPKPAAAKPAVQAPANPPVVAKAAPTQAAKPPVTAPKIAAKVSAPALQAAAPAPAPKAPEPTVQMPVMSATPSLANMRTVIEELDDLSDTQTIRLLERHTPFREGSSEANVDEAIRVIKPEDAQSMQAIKNEVKRNAPVLFAVQLDWSVTPFDMAKVPPLAIFNAYTLYTTEANREGRTWFGLRLGFFSDAVSAKQVAYYVRSDFKTVSVVPVTTIEKERANDINAARSGIHRAANVKDGPAPTPQSIASSNASGVFKLLDDDLPAMIEQDVDGETSPRFGKQNPVAPVSPAKAPPASAAPPVTAKASKARKPGARGVRRDANAHVDEETLDQTLEILGAHTLEITNDSSSNTGVRHLRVKVDKKGSKFASLIDRLSGKK